MPALPWGKPGSAGRAGSYVDDVGDAASLSDDVARGAMGLTDNAAGMVDDAARYGDDVARGASGSRTVNPSVLCSFSADTPVATLDGSLPIVALAVGDGVLAWDESLNVTGMYTVTALWVHTDTTILDLTLPYSNGPVEGHIHRLKLLKRQMYGRAALPLLAARFLYTPADCS